MAVKMDLQHILDAIFNRCVRVVLLNKFIADDKDLSFLNEGNSLTNENTLPF